MSSSFVQPSHYMSINDDIQDDDSDNPTIHHYHQYDRNPSKLHDQSIPYLIFQYLTALRYVFPDAVFQLLQYLPMLLIYSYLLHLNGVSMAYSLCVIACIQSICTFIGTFLTAPHHGSFFIGFSTQQIPLTSYFCSVLVNNYHYRFTEVLLFTAIAQTITLLINAAGLTTPFLSYLPRSFRAGLQIGSFVFLSSEAIHLLTQSIGLPNSSTQLYLASFGLYFAAIGIFVVSFLTMNHHYLTSPPLNQRPLVIVSHTRHYQQHPQTLTTQFPAGSPVHHVAPTLSAHRRTHTRWIHQFQAITMAIITGIVLYIALIQLFTGASDSFLASPLASVYTNPQFPRGYSKDHKTRAWFSLHEAFNDRLNPFTAYATKKSTFLGSIMSMLTSPQYYIDITVIFGFVVLFLCDFMNTIEFFELVQHSEEKRHSAYAHRIAERERLLSFAQRCPHGPRSLTDRAHTDNNPLIEPHKSAKNGKKYRRRSRNISSQDSEPHNLPHIPEMDEKLSNKHEESIEPFQFVPSPQEPPQIPTNTSSIAHDTTVLANHYHNSHNLPDTRSHHRPNCPHAADDTKDTREKNTVNCFFSNPPTTETITPAETTLETSQNDIISHLKRRSRPDIAAELTQMSQGTPNIVNNISNDNRFAHIKPMYASGNTSTTIKQDSQQQPFSATTKAMFDNLHADDDPETFHDLVNADEIKDDEEELLHPHKKQHTLTLQPLMLTPSYDPKSSDIQSMKKGSDNTVSQSQKTPSPPLFHPGVVDPYNSQHYYSDNDYVTLSESSIDQNPTKDNTSTTQRDDTTDIIIKINTPMSTTTVFPSTASYQRSDDYFAPATTHTVPKTSKTTFHNNYKPAILLNPPPYSTLITQIPQIPSNTQHLFTFTSLLNIIVLWFGFPGLSMTPLIPTFITKQMPPTHRSSFQQEHTEHAVLRVYSVLLFITVGLCFPVILTYVYMRLLVIATILTTFTLQGIYLAVNQHYFFYAKLVYPLRSSTVGSLGPDTIQGDDVQVMISIITFATTTFFMIRGDFHVAVAAGLLYVCMHSIAHRIYRSTFCGHSSSHEYSNLNYTHLSSLDEDSDMEIIMQPHESSRPHSGLHHENLDTRYYHSTYSRDEYDPIPATGSSSAIRHTQPI